MEKKTKKVLALGLLGLTALSFGAVGVSAYNQEGNGFGKQMNSNYEGNGENRYETFQEREMGMNRGIDNEEIQTAIENGDYEAFVAAHEDNNIIPPSEEEFNAIIERRELHDKIEEAIEEGNYDMWLSAIQEMPFGEDMSELISEDEFDLYIEMHELREEGNFQEAKEIADELGLERGMGKGMGGPGMKGQGMHRLG